MSFRTVFIENSCRCSYSSGYLVVRKESETVKIHLSEIYSIILQDEQVFISAYLMAELAKNKIPLIVSDEKKNPVGQYLPLYGAHNVSKRVAEQLEWGEPVKKRVWQRVVKDKIEQQADLLERKGHPEAGELLALSADVRSGDTTNREACAARQYFVTLFGGSFSRDDTTELNAALDYGYAVLLSMVNREIAARGYLTQRGICHRNEYNQFNLACDLMEPFRPIVDLLVIDNLVDEFDQDLRRVLGDLGNKSVAYRGGVYKLSSVVSLYVQDCLNALNKKCAPADIEPFKML